MEFSHDDRHLLTVSRDRQFSILEKVENTAKTAESENAAKTAENEVSFRIAATKPKAHARILWGCAWSRDDALFATASRDKTVKLWAGRTAAKLVATIETPDAATAVAFAPRDYGAQYVLAVGEEDGRISLWRGGAAGGWTAYAAVPAHLGHVSVVRRLRWRNEKEGKEKEKEKEKKERLLLASCSSDWSVRLFSLEIP
jgi:elongator complex protein 2